MATFSLILIALVFFVLFYFAVPSVFNRPSASKYQFPSQLPGPSLRSYLPGGCVFPMLLDPHRFSQVLNTLCAKYGPVYQMNILLKRSIVTSDADDVLQLFSSSREEFPIFEAVTAVSEYVIPNSLITMEVKQHDHVRKNIRENFNSKQLEKYHESMSSAIEELCSQLNEKLSQDNVENEFSSDLVELLAVITFRSISNIALGSPLDLKGRLLFADKVNKLITFWLKDILMFPLGEKLAPFGMRKKLNEYKAAVLKLTATIVDQRLQDDQSSTNRKCIDGDSDLLDILISLFKDDRETLLSQVFFVISAGAHTVTQVTTWMMFYLCKHPEVQSKVLMEINQVEPTAGLSHTDLERKFPYTKAVWRETLRFNPPVSTSFKVAGSDVKLRGSGICVPKGTPVAGFLSVTQLSERYWTNALDFNPDRWIDAKTNSVRRPPGVPPGAYLPYGVGQRNCLGSFFADYEGVFMIIELLRRYEFKLDCDPSEVLSCTDFIESIAYSRRQDSILHMGLPVRVSHRTRK